MKRDPKKKRCPKCGAKVGKPCRAKNHFGTLSGVRPHRERIRELFGKK